MSEGFAVLMAAVISAFVAVVGLVITKENKISEFRQQWIDGLRADVSELIGTVNANQIGHEGRASYRDIQLKLKELQYRIELRFHRGDATAQPLISAVIELVGNCGTLNREIPEPFVYKLVTDVKEKTQEILKDEWERVKAGEERYRQTLRISKRAAIALAAIVVVYLCVWAIIHILIPASIWFVSQFKG